MVIHGRLGSHSSRCVLELLCDFSPAGPLANALLVIGIAAMSVAITLRSLPRWRDRRFQPIAGAHLRGLGRRYPPPLHRAPSAAFRVDAISAVEQVWIRGIHVAERQERDAEAADRGEDTV